MSGCNKQDALAELQELSADRQWSERVLQIRSRCSVHFSGCATKEELRRPESYYNLHATQSSSLSGSPQTWKLCVRDPISRHPALGVQGNNGGILGPFCPQDVNVAVQGGMQTRYIRMSTAAHEAGDRSRQLAIR